MKIRLDQLLLLQGLAPTLQKAQALQSEHLSGLTAGLRLPGMP